MPDQSQDSGNTKQKDQQEESTFDSSTGTQGQWDQVFRQMTQGVLPSPQLAQELLRLQSTSYFRLMEDSIRSARETTDHIVLYAARQEITQQAAQQAVSQVIGYFQQNPQVLQQLIRNSQ